MEAPVRRPLSVPPTVYLLATQATATEVMLAAATLPAPLVTVQVWPVGWVPTVTEYAAPVASAVVNLKAPLAESERELALLLSSVTLVPVFKPLSVPPMV